MTTIFRSFTIVAALAVSATPVAAHAFLDHATPGVGSTVSVSPVALDLVFTQTIEVALSTVRVAAVGGGAVGGEAVAMAKPTKDPSDGAVLHVRANRPLPPGIYVVTWHVVSVDTHATSGSYRFTVSR